MLIIDFQQVMLANLHMQLGLNKQATIEPGLLKHMILNTLRSLILKFKPENSDGKIVIACDNRISWRRNVFPYYKAARKKTRDASSLDWKAIFEVFEQMKKDLRENFPYVVIDIEGCEADDIIGTLVHYYSDPSTDHFRYNAIIVSGDQDFIQLHNREVIQYDTVRKRFITSTNPDYLLEHILDGDRGDGIPNVLSDDDSFVVGKRQSPLRQKTSLRMIEEYKKDAPRVDWEPITTHRFLRNRRLIDLQYTPQDLKTAIITEFETQTATPKRPNVLNYMIQNRMSNLLDKVQEFV